MASVKFKSKHHAHNQRKHCWACTKCSAFYTVKQTACLDCHNQLQYFPSQGEFLRFRNLQLQLRTGEITDLELQPTYPVVINGIKVFEYRADFKYKRKGIEIIEDVKGSMNKDYHDPVFKHKQKVVEAIYGIKISIVT